MQPTPSPLRYEGAPPSLPKLGINFDGWRSGWWRAADAQPLCAKLTWCFW